MLPFQGKAQSLGFLKGSGLHVPEWWVLSHEELLSWGNPTLKEQLQASLNCGSFSLISKAVTAFADSIKIPENIQLKKQRGPWAIRSSAILEDRPNHSFAGIFHTELNLKDNLEQGVKRVWTSLYSEPALRYCQQLNITLEKLAMDVIIQQMIPGEKSGVIFQGEKQIINAVAGYGNLDKDESEYYLIQEAEVIDFQRGGKTSVLNEKDLDQLLGASEKIKAHTNIPLDLEFTFAQGILYFLQARPITAIPPHPKKHSSSALQGIPCSEGQVEAPCLVVDQSSPDQEVLGKILILKDQQDVQKYIFRNIAGLIMEGGSLLSHAGVLARELKIPAIIKVKNARKLLRNSTRIQMDGSTGEIRP